MDAKIVYVKGDEWDCCGYGEENDLEWYRALAAGPGEDCGDRRHYKSPTAAEREKTVRAWAAGQSPSASDLTILGMRRVHLVQVRAPHVATAAITLGVL